MRPLNPGEIPTRKAALSRARALGCTIEYGNGGEVRVTAPSGARCVMNNRRTDCSSAMLKLLRDAENGTGGTNPPMPLRQPRRAVK